MRQKIVAGNWKMNKTIAQGLQLVDEIILKSANQALPHVLKIILPPFTHLTAVDDRLKLHTDFAVGAQNCHHMSKGPYTGEVSAETIASTGAQYVIIGHSERRLHFGENSTLLSQKINTALAALLIPIFCLGESLEERNSNNHLEAVKQQLKDALFHLSPADFSKLIIAYEPVWAIGTGSTATTHQAQGMHHFIRSEINKKYGKEISENISILYGGSCNAQNAKDLFACLDVDGGLIGGASLNAADFITISNSF
ncbi:MAG: triose-phosphate isomerase [Bacteroidetes bacterium]|nr:triose-phosphate isomerase [Bacteroidota bacterium]